MFLFNLAKNCCPSSSHPIQLILYFAVHHSFLSFTEVFRIIAFSTV